MFLIYFRVRNNLRGKLGPVPTTMEAVIAQGVPPVYRKTVGGEPFLRYIIKK